MVNLPRPVRVLVWLMLVYYGISVIRLFVSAAGLGA
jgi:hypothetical protein